MSLAALPADWSGEETFKSLNDISAPVKRSLEPVGPGFLAHARRTLKGRTWSEDEKLEAQRNVKSTENDEDDEEEEDVDPEDLERDPKDWKEQDHYAVMGLSKYRYKATEEQIRNAYRKRVLKHHPDKKAKDGVLNADGFFKCIQKAYELLLDPTKRLQWDSVDPKADVPPPSKKTKGDFITLWTPVFEAEGRFSKKEPVPKLGTMESTKEEVDNFYKFFYNFDSWRTFEYLDEDVPDDTSNRDNKRYIEKKNKAARQKRKVEDNARLRKVVEQAQAVDPRIKMFKENAQKEKAQKKWEREAGAREAAEKAKKEAEEAERKKKEEEEAAKSNKESAKKAKEAAKAAKKKNKRNIRASAKDANYFVSGEPSADNIASVLTDVDLIIEKLDDVTLQDLATGVSGQTDADKIKTAFVDAANKAGVSGLKFFSSA